LGEVSGDGDVGGAESTGWEVDWTDARAGGSEGSGFVFVGVGLDGGIGVIDEDAIFAIDGEVDVEEEDVLAMRDEGFAEASGDAFFLIAEGVVDMEGIVLLVVDGWDAAGVMASIGAEGGGVAFVAMGAGEASAVSEVAEVAEVFAGFSAVAWMLAGSSFSGQVASSVVFWLVEVGDSVGIVEDLIAGLIGDSAGAVHARGSEQGREECGGQEEEGCG